MGGGQILWLEYANAGQAYSSATYSLASGTGYGAAVSAANFVTNAVPEVRVITGGTGYVTNKRCTVRNINYYYAKCG